MLDRDSGVGEMRAAGLLLFPFKILAERALEVAPALTVSACLAPF